MHIVTRLTLDKATVLHSYQACHRRSIALRWAASLFVVAVGLLSRNVFFILLGILALAFSERVVRRQLKPYLVGPREITITISDEGYAVDGVDRSSFRAWSSFRRVERTGDFWVLRTDGSAALAVPTAALDAEQTAQFTAAMRSLRLLAVP